MMAALRKLFSFDRPEPVTHETVKPAPRDQARERQIRAAHADLVQELMCMERKSWEIRQELAGNVIDIVSGQRR